MTGKTRKDPWSASTTTGDRPLPDRPNAPVNPGRSTTLDFLIVLAWLIGALIAISAIYVAVPGLRVFLYISLIGLPVAFFLDYTFAAAPYLLGAYVGSLTLHLLFPRLPGLIAILAPILAVGGWLYIHANSLNSDLRAAAIEALALTDQSLPDDLDLSRVAMKVDGTECSLLCQRLLVSEVADEVLLFDASVQEFTSDQYLDVPAVTWRIEERDTCPTPRFSRPSTQNTTQADQDFTVLVQAILSDGRCIVEEQGTLANATAIINRQLVTSDGFRGQRVSLLQPRGGEIEPTYVTGGGTLSEVRHPAIRIRLPVGMFEDLRLDYMTQQVPYGASFDAMSNESILRSIIGSDLQVTGFDGFDRHEALLRVVQSATDPEDNALYRALLDFTADFARDTDGPTPWDLDLVLTILENPNSPVPYNLFWVVVPSEAVPDDVLEEIANAAWSRIVAANRDESGAQNVFVSLPSHIVASFRDELFKLAEGALEQRSNVRTLARLLDFGEEGALALAGLLNQIESHERIIGNTIYETVFENLCDAHGARTEELRESIRQSILSGQLDIYQWSRDRDVVGVLNAMGFDETSISEMGESHASLHRRDRTQSTIDWVHMQQHCLS